MITIYHLGVSQSDRIVWLAEELGLDYQIEWFHRGPTMVAPDELKAIHPMGRAPVIRDGALVLAESGAIVQYLIERHGEGKLAVPAGAPNHADYLFWFHFAGSSFMPLVMVEMVSRGEAGGGALFCGRASVGGGHHDGLPADHDGALRRARPERFSGNHRLCRAPERTPGLCQGHVHRGAGQALIVFRPPGSGT
jgi:glutathione S-transferase